MRSQKGLAGPEWAAVTVGRGVEISGALVDVGFTVPGQSWTYWNAGPGPGPSYLEADHGQDWSHSTGDMMAHNLAAVAHALADRPIPPQS